MRTEGLDCHHQHQNINSYHLVIIPYVSSTMQITYVNSTNTLLCSESITSFLTTIFKAGVLIVANAA